jgi:ABC-type cobalamin/Fe3+-siderophores transport system ATPase subunit
MLEIKNLSLNLEAEPVLKNINLSAKPGEILGIIGPNGAGKTTLLRAIAGVITIKSGGMELDGEELVKKSIVERAKLIASVPQASTLPVSFSVLDMVMLGRTPYLNWLGQTSSLDEKISHTALQQTQSIDLSERKLGELSAGEQQRVLLARALAQSTPVLLMDEPTTHLDLRFQIELLDLVKQLTMQKSIITIIVLHDLNLASRYADEMILLEQGQIAAFGKPQKVLIDSVLSRVYQIPIVVDKKNKNPRIFPK